MTTTCLGRNVKNCAERFCWYHGPVLRKVGESFKFHHIFRAKHTRAAFRLGKYTAFRITLLVEGPL